MVAAAVAGAAVVGAGATVASANKGASAQKNAANAADSTELAEYNHTRDDQAPWRTAGQGALAKLQYGLGIGSTTGAGVPQTQDNFDSNAYYAANPDVAANFATGKTQALDGHYMTAPEYAWYHYTNSGQNEGRAFTYTPAAQTQMQQQPASNTAGTSGGYGDLLRNFTMADYQADPGYQFRQDQGEKSIDRNAIAAGRYNSGATLKALDTFNSGLASQEYGNAYNRFNTNQAKQFNDLASLAGLGQTATNQTDAAGLTTASQIGSNTLAAGNASAAAGIATGNAISNGIGQGLNYWQGQNYINALRPTSTTTSDPYYTNANSNGWT